MNQIPLEEGDAMQDQYQDQGQEQEYIPVEESHTLRNVALAFAVLFVLGSTIFMYTLYQHIGALEAAQKAAADDAAAHNAAIMKKLGMTEASVQEASRELAMKLGQTQKDVASRTAELRKQQEASEKLLSSNISSVATEVGGVKTDLTGAKTDIASTRTDLEATKSKLDRAMGDLGVQSGLIAHTQQDLEYLKHKGDRNYYEFTLYKGKKPTPVSTVSLQLKKVDAKHGRFSLNVLADDRTIEKKDRTVAEPMQFYTGRDRNLYEIVVFTAKKNEITGYLSTPKNAPAPVQATANN
ncbi:MAG TPA: hypothetical protein VKW78_05630 [Terriglobales bacterium]|nr:hypothetical protein [Terriglobales bacterium]